MIAHQYLPGEALDLLLRKVDSQDADLAEQMRSAIDAGKDVEEEEVSIGRRRKGRRYRKAVPLTDKEALQAALEVLRAYFVEQPLFVSSALDEFRTAVIGETMRKRPSSKAGGTARGPAVVGQDLEKKVEIEQRVETQISRSNTEVRPMVRIDAASVEQQKRNLQALCHLIDFNEE